MEELGEQARGVSSRHGRRWVGGGRHGRRDVGGRWMWDEESRSGGASEASVVLGWSGGEGWRDG